MSWKILLTDGLEENGQAVLRQFADVVDQPGISAEDLLPVVHQYDAMIVRGRTKVTPAVFAAAPGLKVVGRSGVGVDNIDLAAARQHGVTVVNAPIATTIAVAELTLGLMLSMIREISPRADCGMKAGKWLKKEMEGNELYQKTLGIIGCGRIGTAVAQRAAAFGMTVIGYDALKPAEELRKQAIEPVELEQLYRRADIITIHTPLTNDTREMIGAHEMDMMKPGVRLICTARGNIINETALLAALESGHVAGAALDVFSVEPPGQVALVNHPHVIATPHIGAQTSEAQQRAAADIASEVLAALRGEPLRWKVA